MNNQITFVRLSSGHIQMRRNGKYKDGNRFAIGTKVKVENPKNWNASKYSVKSKEKYAYLKNQRLNLLKTNLLSILKDYQYKGEMPSIKRLRNELLSSIGEAKEKLNNKDSRFLNFNSKYIDYLVDNKKPRNTVNAYKTFYRLFSDFLQQSKYYNKDIEFEEIDFDCSKQFEIYLKNQISVKSQNTIAHNITILKSLMNKARKRELHNSNKQRLFEIKRETSDSIFLTDNEINKIYELDFSIDVKYNRSKYLDESRDLFVFACLTGLRFSDWKEIKPENIQQRNGNYFFYKKAQKTKDSLNIPLSVKCVEILKKYDFSLPKAKTAVSVNRHLEEIGKQALIDELVTLEMPYGTITGEKYKFIKTHTARRSFATNAYLDKDNPISLGALMLLTGHKTEKSFFKYIRISKKQNANELSNHPRFKN